MDQKILLEARGVRKVFPGTVALDGVDLELRSGEIHALMGENGAGKSTFLNIITGSLHPDNGTICVNGEDVVFSSPMDAKRKGIAIVHQELSLFPEISVMENILVGITPSRYGLMNRRQMTEICDRYLRRFEVQFTLQTLVRDLSVSQQQIVEIVKALVTGAEVYIFDEPTSALSVEDASRLFVVLRELKAMGKGIVYVSHKFDEIFQLSDRISVLRDGRMIGTAPTNQLSSDDVIRMMVGRSLERIYPAKGNPSDQVILRVNDLNAGSKCRNVSFDLRQGEILGVFGLVGSGRTEIMRALTGIDMRTSGGVELRGKEVRIHSVQDSIRHGLYYLTEDRKQQGLFLSMSIRDNVSVTHLAALSKGGLLDRTQAANLSANVIRDLRVKSRSDQQLVGSLSGGNQQKVMIGKWLSLHPQVVILDEPTRGIDVGAKSEIHQLLRNLASSGIGVIVISSELPEIVGLSDRVLVIHNGTVAGVLSGDQVCDETIMEYASGLHATVAG
ncbi:monosaccharide ABC transporter ATP-binding protein (CUT2 family) [Alicyclobacillus sacchari]|uniref:Monosaccharide ABC transporter ATP-binding protein (CUT2 family) n=1 Tax=Alicyclobacillus sacchari TaxID=392010 RepID=A0A4R8L6K1_9BACL|nr:sugar ABC transporter ATP-binding protein [Alicyclobacillus sacchari]TDY38251.1 monosaccharide ABC transporter ATP-binding protein (CUT2 family) [Alicyclobacillus sacchari]GMA57375.1 putative ribose/galactose/methyl galactoside import ATP-binding protein 2 [Alicyclobacillus sacchari]